MLQLFSEGRLQDVSESSRDFAHEANADMKFKAIWWLTGIVGDTNLFRGEVYDYQPVWGTGNALIKLSKADTPLGANDTRNKDFDDLEIPEVDLGNEPSSKKNNRCF